MVAGIAIGLAAAALLGVLAVGWWIVRVSDEMAARLQAMMDAEDDEQEWDD